MDITHCTLASHMGLVHAFHSDIALNLNDDQLIALKKLEYLCMVFILVY